VLDPEVVLRADSGAAPAGASRRVRGAPAVVKRVAKGRARAARPALVKIDAIADPERVDQLDLALLDD
jgi:hypothetical protein